jgi:3-phenylpropionate/cinnamic acid dioxygenase small subunit
VKTSRRSDGDADRAIQRLMARYCHLVDDGAFEEIPALWTDDAELLLRGETATGPAAIVARIADRQTPELRGLHVSANVIIDVDGDTARAVSDFVFMRREGGPDPLVKFIGRYLDRFVRMPDGWRFRRREIVFRGSS